MHLYLLRLRPRANIRRVRTLAKMIQEGGEEKEERTRNGRETSPQIQRRLAHGDGPLKLSFKAWPGPVAAARVGVPRVLAWLAYSPKSSVDSGGLVQELVHDRVRGLFLRSAFG